MNTFASSRFPVDLNYAGEDRDLARVIVLEALTDAVVYFRAQ
jgi:hypothetical protein